MFLLLGYREPTLEGSQCVASLRPPVEDPTNDNINMYFIMFSIMYYKML